MYNFYHVGVNKLNSNSLVEIFLTITTNMPKEEREETSTVEPRHLVLGCVEFMNVLEQNHLWGMEG
jgi:hypothetical protein